MITLLTVKFKNCYREKALQKEHFPSGAHTLGIPKIPIFNYIKILMCIFYGTAIQLLRIISSVGIQNLFHSLQSSASFDLRG